MFICMKAVCDSSWVHAFLNSKLAFFPSAATLSRYLKFFRASDRALDAGDDDDDDLWSSGKEVSLLKMLGSGKECFHSGIKVVRYFMIRRNYVGSLKRLGSMKMPSQIEG